jgi:rare lipoprotein A (peptidoglycan hydrolase)
MKILTLSILTLCAGLCTAPAMAGELSVPDKEKRQGMSYEEYSNYREKMRQRMASEQPADSRQVTSPSDGTQAETEQAGHASSYGQGYSSRKPAADRPDRPARAERFSRDAMGRR